MHTESQDKLTPNTPWTEPRTPEFSPGLHEPVIYRSSLEIDYRDEDIDKHNL